MYGFAHEYSHVCVKSHILIHVHVRHLCNLCLRTGSHLFSLTHSDTVWVYQTMRECTCMFIYWLCVFTDFVYTCMFIYWLCVFSYLWAMCSSWACHVHAICMNKYAIMSVSMPSGMHSQVVCPCFILLFFASYWVCICLRLFMLTVSGSKRSTARVFSCVYLKAEAYTRSLHN
jgi:hypothetical protein